MPKLLKPYLDFRGGENVDAAPDSLADNELMEGLNCDLDERGATSKRKGTAPINAVSYGAEVEQIIEWPRKDGTKVLLGIVGATLTKIADNGTKTDLKVLDNKEIGHFFYADKFYFTGMESGTNKYWVYDGTTISEVTANAAGDNDLAPIKRCRRFLWHTKSQRIFAARDSSDLTALYYSEPGDPTYFKGTSKLFPTTGDGPVYNLSLFGEAMAVLYQNSIWAWKGVSPATDAEWLKLPSEYGTLAARSPRLTPNSLTFLGQGGLISVSLGIVDQNIVMLTGEELIKNLAENKVSKKIRAITNPGIACAIYDRTNDRYLLAYADTEGATRNNKVLVLNWNLKSFTTYSSWQVNDFLQRANGDILIATNGYILKIGQGYRDFDTATGGYKAITFRIKTKHWNLDYPFHTKKSKRLFVAAKQYDLETSSCDLTINADYESISFNSITLEDSFIWGEMWGNQWGYSDLTTKEIKFNKKGQRFQITVENNSIDEPITVYGMAFEYKLKKPKGERVS